MNRSVTQSATQPAIQTGFMATDNVKFYLPLLVLAIIALAGVLWPRQGLDINLLAKNLPPSFAHPFGTDWLGRDMLTRSLKALNTSMGIGVIAVGSSCLIAMCLSMLAMVNRITRAAVDLIVDVFMSLPHLLLLILLSLAFGGSEPGLIGAVALSHWPRLTRLLRFEMQSVLNAPYYQLARQFGQPTLVVVRRHMLPHVIPQWLTGAVLLFPHALTHMAGLTFLGFGMDPSTPSMGVLLSQASSYLLTGTWWLAVFPGALLLLSLLLLSDFARHVSQQVQGDNTHSSTHSSHHTRKHLEGFDATH